MINQATFNPKYLGMNYAIRRIDNNALVAVVVLSVEDENNNIDPLIFFKVKFDNDHKFDVYFGSIKNLYADNIPVETSVISLY